MRGLAHIGVLLALEEGFVRVDRVESAPADIVEAGRLAASGAVEALHDLLTAGSGAV